MVEILDASALLAFLKEEQGYKKVNQLLQEAHRQKFTVFIHQVNYIEVVRKLLQNFGTAETKNILVHLVQPFLGISNLMNDEMATYATQFLAKPGISMADSIGLAFAKIMEGRFWTADKILKNLAEEAAIKLELIRD